MRFKREDTVLAVTVQGSRVRQVQEAGTDSEAEEEKQTTTVRGERHHSGHVSGGKGSMWQRRRKRGIQLTVSKTRDTTRMQGYRQTISSNDSAPLPATDEKWHPDEKGYQEYGDNGEDDDDNDDDEEEEEEEEEENAHRLRSAPMQGGRASLWRLVPPTDMKAEEVDEATPKNADPDQQVAKRMELSTPY